MKNFWRDHDTEIVFLSIIIGIFLFVYAIITLPDMSTGGDKTLVTVDKIISSSTANHIRVYWQLEFIEFPNTVFMVRYSDNQIKEGQQFLLGKTLNGRLRIWENRIKL
jgi:hypothetical protein